MCLEIVLEPQPDYAKLAEASAMEKQRHKGLKTSNGSDKG